MYISPKGACEKIFKMVNYSQCNLPSCLIYRKKLFLQTDGLEEDLLMHMADALIVPSVAATMYACSGVAAGYSVKKIHTDYDMKEVPMMGVMGAFVFATQMINFTIPGTGSSGHLCGGMLLTALLGPYAAFITMIGVLLIQCLLFADGGLLALGCNIWNMAFYGCFIGYYLIWHPMMKKGLSRKKIIAASILGSVLTLQMGAFSVSVETFLSGVSELPFAAFVGTMQPIHLAIGLVEGLITAAVLCFVYQARPQLLQDGTEEQKENGVFSVGKTLTVLGIAAVVVGGALSLFASSHPDGLEWSIQKMTGSTELSAGTGAAYQIAEKIQSMTSLLPDYAFKGSESVAGTSVSGIFGTLLVLVVCAGVCYLIKYMRKKKVKAE